jgi:hypothetical protein
MSFIEEYYNDPPNIELPNITELSRRNRNDIFYTFAHLHPDFNLDMIHDKNMAHFLSDWNYPVIILKHGQDFWDMIEKHLDTKWPWRYIFECRHIYVNWNIQFPNEAYKYASNNQSITLEILKRYIDKPWDFRELTRNFNFNTIIQNADMPWSFSVLSYRMSLDFKDIHQHKEKGWEWKIITQRFCRHMNVFFDHSDIPWDMNVVCSQVYDFKWSVIEEYPDIQWDFVALCQRGDFTWDIFSKYPDKPWCYDTLCYLDEFDWNMVVRYPNKQWNYNILACRKDIDMRVIDKTREKWSMRRISKNPAITENTVKKYYHLHWKGKWSAIRRMHAANIIKKYWREVVSNPYHPICQRRLLYEFNRLSSC